MERREFLRFLGALIALVSYGSQSGFGLPQNTGVAARPKSGRKTKVSLAAVRRGASEQVMKAAVRAAAEATTNFSWLSRGDAVFIKPALNSAGRYPATTSPIAIGAMIKLLKEKGAGRVIIGDMSGIEHVKLSPEGSSGSTRRLMEASGMARAVLAAGGEMHFFEESGWNAFYEDAPAAGSLWKRGLMMPNILKEVEHIVLMPRCARHALAGSTLGLKAAVGYWRTDTRLEYHRDASTFQEKTADGNTVATLLKKQRLVISAADKLLTTFGPDKGYVYQPEYGLVIASESTVAHDMVSLAWLLENRENIPHSEKDGIKDPYNSQMVVGIANRWVVKMLGGWKPALFAEKLTRNDINAIWNDRVLNRAYQVFGGAPRISLIPANKLLNEKLKKRLSEMTAYPS